MMPNRRPRRSRQRNNIGEQSQVLLHPMTVVSSATNVTSILQPVSGIIANRPARPDHVTVEYYSVNPRSFTFTVFGGNLEEVYRSPVLISGPIPKKFQIPLPKTTDFALYAATGNVIQFTHALNPAIFFTVNMRVSYKTALPTSSAF